FPNDISREEARRQLNLSQDAFVYLYFGNARTYKGIEDLIEAFRRVAADDDRLVLMMRRAFNAEYADQVTAQAGKDARIGVHTSPFFGNEEFQVYLNACDVTVFPFSDVLTSGSAIAALSFGKPLIAPKLGCLTELLDDTTGILYEPKDEGALDEALLQARRIDLAEAGSAARRRALSLDWDEIAAQVAELYAG
ncbi:MAG: glycosyltransferase, partial [Candidatus Latescibacteria bacterium]|nr:glycosyltransferase [Candidatus Latescibacterota bacterium]